MEVTRKNNLVELYLLLLKSVNRLFQILQNLSEIPKSINTELLFPDNRKTLSEVCE